MLSCFPMYSGVNAEYMGKQDNIPEGEVERTKQGWKQNFWEPIKMFFGFGYNWK
eukprot:NODE_9335_length_322_cov_26.912088_g7569_i0.p4 GENE.NODE_9335_length_322_cov_26.912088_g7569_i0~~NODE_9335_length_322_cov_26.912088_g7569_i0.p4  ORF type:complete len:54 (+),score=28.83 NODE_9335_length_322_cov_26.912088_g7569_i0:1-162(+)